MVNLTPNTVRTLLAVDAFGVGDGLRLGDGLADGDFDGDGDGLADVGSGEGRAVASSSTAGDAGPFHWAAVCVGLIPAQPVSASTTTATRGTSSLFTAAV
jgi:hypothetical protein